MIYITHIIKHYDGRYLKQRLILVGQSDKTVETQPHAIACYCKVIMNIVKQWISCELGSGSESLDYVFSYVFRLIYWASRHVTFLQDQSTRHLSQYTKL